MEELANDSLSDATVRKPGTLEAWEQAQALEGLDVLDLGSRRVGRVTKCFVEDGALVACEMRLDKGLARALGVLADTARFEPDVIRETSADGVRLNVPADQVLGVAPEPEDGGSSTFPRTER